MSYAQYAWVNYVIENTCRYSCAVVSILQNHVTVLLNLQTRCVSILMIFCLHYCHNSRRRKIHSLPTKAVSIKRMLIPKDPFLANVNWRSRSLYAIARPSVVCLSVCLSVCNARAPYSGGSNFRQYFYGIRYLGHPLTSTEKFTDIVPGHPLRRGSWTQEG